MGSFKRMVGLENEGLDQGGYCSYYSSLDYQLDVMASLLQELKV